MLNPSSVWHVTWRSICCALWRPSDLFVSQFHQQFRKFVSHFFTRRKSMFVLRSISQSVYLQFSLSFSSDSFQPIRKSLRHFDGWVGCADNLLWRLWVCTDWKYLLVFYTRLGQNIRRRRGPEDQREDRLTTLDASCLRSSSLIR